MIEHPILLWNAEDISWALSAENGFARALEMKLRVAIEHGLPDFFVGSHELASVSPDPLEPGPPVDVVSGARVIVIVEGENDRVLLTKLLDTRFDRSAYRVVPARGKEAAQALARSLAAVGRTAVVLMFDADTREAEGIALQKAEAEDALQLAAGDDMSLVVVLAPELEALVLRPDAFALAFPGEPPLDSNEEELATDRPRRVLEHRLGGTGRGQFFSRLSPSTIEKIAQDPQLEALFAFVASHVGPSGAVRHP
ncbi:hypothetical protein DB32_000566 [Sandaracinus amylolyticus]|uniref:Toprim domain-containing protein n=2 Tax=Sandaracinus amylolyticus TaxID=927083 RepID=A0A0F6VZ96_9BACT|nr:hypothetical protein DB32_000566 [Sandaracinus amylolyticus]